MRDNQNKLSPNYGFPSHQLPAAQKNKKWHLQYVKAFYKEHTTGGSRVLRHAWEEYEKWRAYATGRQPIDQYKELMGIKKRNGKREPSWRNLDWNILPIMPKFREILINKIKGNKKDLKINAIDPFSVNEERNRRNEILAYISNQEFLQSVSEQTGIEFDSPIEQGAPMPQNAQELDLYMNMFPKNRHVLELYDEIRLVKNVNNWKQIENDIIANLVDVGIGGSRTYIDSNGYLKMRSIVPERIITNACIKNDFSDLIRIAEFVPMTISDLRQLAPKGTFSEADFAAMASKSAGKTYNVEYNASYFEKFNCYPYDHEMVTVMDAQWFSADDLAYVVSKDAQGRLHVDKKDNPYWLDKKKISDDDYKSYYKQKGEERYIERATIKNVYQAMWVIDTDYIFNYGLKTDMIRQASALSDTRLDYVLYTTDFDSVMRRLESVLDNIQINWLQFQHHLAQSKPSGVAIERRAISRMEIGGKGGLNLSPEDILKMYAETGSYIYNGTDSAGRPYPFKPIEELKNGISDAAQQHFNFILQDINLIRDILGINEVADGSNPNPELSKALAQTALQGTNNALGNFYHAYSSILERTSQAAVLLIPDAKKLGVAKGWEEALGKNSDKYWRLNSDSSYIEFGIEIKDGFNIEQVTAIRNYLGQSLKSAGGVLLPEDALLIEMELQENPMRAYQMLVAKNRQRQKEEQMMKLELYKAEEEKNINSARAAEEEKRLTLQEELAYEQALSELRKSEITHQKQLEMMYLKLEKGYTLDAEETKLSKKYVNDLLLLREKGRQDYEKQRLLSQQRQIRKPVSTK